MSILIKHNWGLVTEEIWNSLSSSGHDDIYVELLRSYYQVLRYDLLEKSDILTNEELASEEFRQVLSWPINEQTCIKILEGFYDVLQDLYEPKISEEYRNNLKKIFEYHNLRYVVTPNCKIGLSIQGLLSTLLLRLRKNVETSNTTQESLKQLEKSIAKLENSDESFRNCMTIACNLIEGAAKDKTGNKFNNLKKAVDSCPVIFPHNSIKESVKSLYDYLSDYPNLRHSGTEANRIRDLKLDDASLVTALAIGFASFLVANDDGQSIIIGEF